MVDARVCKRVDGALQTGQAVLDGAGVGRLQKIKADGRQRHGK